MKQFIRDVVIGLVILFCLDFVIGKTLRHFYFTEDSGIDYRTTYALNETEADVLIFGSSRAKNHYNPRIIEDSLNVTAYNTGRDGEFIFYQTAILRSVLKRYKPKMLILDFAGTFRYEQEDYDRISVLLPYYETHPELKDIILLKSPFERYKLLSNIYPYNSMLTTMAAGNMEFNKRRNANIDYHGYIPNHLIHQKKLDSIRTPSNYDIDENKMSLFQEFLTLSKQYEIPMVVICSPEYYLYNRDYSIETCKRICDEYGIPFVDFTKDSEFLKHHEFFEDQRHLNEVGADLFTKRVLGLIRKQYLHSTFSID